MARLQLTIGTAVPTLATDGNPLRIGESIGKPEQGFMEGFYDWLVLFYRATVTAGETATMSFLQIWIYSSLDGAAADWYPVGPIAAGGTDTDRGKLNNLVALGEIGTDKINFTQVINRLAAAERVYLREGTSGGAGYASTAWLRKGKG